MLAYNRRVIVQNLTLDLEPGNQLGLIGPNGAGKTTVLRALAGLLAPRAGAVCLDGKNVGALAPLTRARAIALVPQGEAQAWALTVQEMVALGRAAHRGWLMPLTAHDRAVVERALAHAALSDLRERPLDPLAQEPRVLLLDEPTAHLDLEHQLDLLELVRQLARREQLAVVMAIHDLSLAARYCDQLILLHAGRVRAMGTPEAVLTADHLRAAFGVRGSLYRDPHGQWALSVQANKVIG